MHQSPTERNESCPTSHIKKQAESWKKRHTEQFSSGSRELSCTEPNVISHQKLEASDGEMHRKTSKEEEKSLSTEFANHHL